jgi:hypothetical protein
MFRSRAHDYVYNLKYPSEPLPTDVCESFLHLNETNIINVSKIKKKNIFTLFMLRTSPNTAVSIESLYGILQYSVR